MHSHYGISRKCDVFLGNGNQMICTWTASIEDVMRGQSSFLWCSSARTPLSGPFHVRQLERRDLLDLGVGWRIVWEKPRWGEFASGREEGDWRVSSGVSLFKVCYLWRRTAPWIWPAGSENYHQTTSDHSIPEKYHMCDTKDGDQC